MRSARAPPTGPARFSESRACDAHLLDGRAAQSHRDGRSRGRRRRRARTSSSSRDTTTTSSSGPCPGERDERLRGRKTISRHRARARRIRALRPDARSARGAQPRAPHERRRANSRALQATMLGLLNDQLAAKRLTPSAGAIPGYRPPRRRRRRRLERSGRWFASRHGGPDDQPECTRVLFVYFTYTKQTLKVTEAMVEVFRERGCDVSMAAIELTDPRYTTRFHEQISRPLSRRPDSADEHPGLPPPDGTRLRDWSRRSTRDTGPRRRRRASTESRRRWGLDSASAARPIA